jgi:DNA-binding response OmpR family regulator
VINMIYSKYNIRGAAQGPNFMHEPRRCAPDAGKEAAQTASVERAPGRILLAEDDDDMRNLLAGALRAEGFQVFEVSDGDELIERITCDLLLGEGSCSVDLIITDVRMPGANGLTVLEGLRRVDGWTPVIIITAFGDDMIHAEAHRLGAVAVLDKPFDIGHLRRLARVVTAS